MLDNDQVETQQIKDIQEDIDNYIENSQEPDFFENEYIYDDITGLDDMLLDLRPDQHSVEASETASSTNSVSGNSPVLGQTANHTSSSNHQPRDEDLKRRHRSSQSDDSKVSAKKSGSSGAVSSSNGGVAPVTTSSSGVSVGSAASPLPPAKSSGPPQYTLSQSPNNSSPSSGGVTALMAGLTNHLQTETQRQNFAQAAAPTQNGKCSAGDERC